VQFCLAAVILAAMRVLIATATAGAGHLQAAAAIEEAWNQLRPDDTVERVDVLSFTSPLYRKAYAEGYLKISAHLPDLYSFLFQKTDNPALLKRLTSFRREAAQAGAPRFARYLKDFAPDAVVCTHFLPAEILGQLRAKSGAAFKMTVATVVTDFEAHALWMEPGVDLYCVAAEETKARLVARGLPPGKVIVTGIPVSLRFSKPIDAQAVRRRLGLRDDLHVLLVLSGGFGVGPVGDVMEALDRFETPAQVAVVCGRNEKLRQRLAARDYQHPTRVFGFVTNMPELMAVTSLIITKPGGLTASEALASGKPLCIINPIPGQEAANSDFLLEHGAAIKVNRIEDLPFKLKQAMRPEKLAALSKAARELGRPNAALEIVRAVVSQIQSQS